MILEAQTLRYQWQGNWGGQNGDGAHSHGGIAEDSAGNLYFSFNSAPHVRVFSPAGEQVRNLELSGEQIHCLTISQDNEGEWLWDLNLEQGTISKNTLDGKLIKRIGHADFKVGDERLKVTAMSVDPTTGNLWVTDGYGLYTPGESGGNKVFCFGPNLELQFAFDGTEAACGSFKEPHWILVDTRKPHPEIYIADRSNHRLVVYSNEGKFLRVIDGILHTPSALSLTGDHLVVAELKGRVHVLDKNDNVIGTFADGSAYSQVPGWPNRRDGDNVISPLEDIEEGKLNSPHGLHADKAGNIFVHEWLQGTRITKLNKL